MKLGRFSAIHAPVSRIYKRAAAVLAPVVPGNLGTITVASTGYPAAPNPPEGTSYGANGFEANFYFPLFGTVTGGTSFLVHINAPGAFFGPVDAGWLTLVDGSYSGFTVANGAINGNTSSSQFFTIGNVIETLAPSNFGNVEVPQYRYDFSGDPFGLDTKVGQTLAVNRISPPDIYGTVTVGNTVELGGRYGYQPAFAFGPYGSATTIPASIISSFYYRQSIDTTSLLFNGGTYGSIVVDGLDGFIVGVNSLSVYVGGATQTLVLGGAEAGTYSIAGDPFGLATKNGQTLSLAMTLL